MIGSTSSRDRCSSVGQRHQLGASPPPLIMPTFLTFASATILLISPRFLSRHWRQVQKQQLQQQWLVEVVKAIVPTQLRLRTAVPFHVECGGLILDRMGRGVPRWQNVGSRQLVRALEK